MVLAAAASAFSHHHLSLRVHELARARPCQCHLRAAMAFRLKAIVHRLPGCWSLGDTRGPGTHYLEVAWLCSAGAMFFLTLNLLSRHLHPCPHLYPNCPQGPHSSVSSPPDSAQALEDGTLSPWTPHSRFQLGLLRTERGETTRSRWAAVVL